MTASFDRPAAVLLDIHLPDQSGLEVARRIADDRPAVAVLLTSADPDPSFHARAQSSGACAFVPKSDLARVDLGRFWPGPEQGGRHDPNDRLQFCRLKPGRAG